MSGYVSYLMHHIITATCLNLSALNILNWLGMGVKSPLVSFSTLRSTRECSLTIAYGENYFLGCMDFYLLSPLYKSLTKPYDLRRGRLYTRLFTTTTMKKELLTQCFFVSFSFFWKKNFSFWWKKSFSRKKKN